MSIGINVNYSKSEIPTHTYKDVPVFASNSKQLDTTRNPAIED